MYLQAAEEYGSKTVNVFVLSMEEYLEKFWQFFIPGIMDLYKSITEVLANKIKGKNFNIDNKILKLQLY